MKAKTKSKKTRQVVKKHVKKAIVPRKDNNYRPRIISRYGLTVVAIALVLLQGLNGLLHGGSILGRYSDIDTASLLEETNRVRVSEGAGSLTLSSRLSEAAELKARDMFANQYWAHDSPTGVTPWVWFEQAGYTYQAAGENLAKNFVSSGATVGAWMSSVEHKRNMLDKRFTEAGFAVVSDTLNGEDTTIVVALYGKPAEPGVLGLTDTSGQFAASTSVSLGVIDRLHIFLRSLTPLVVVSLGLLAATTIISIVAHRYRRRMPKSFQRTWKLHHGAIKATGSMFGIVVLVLIYSVGQI